MGRNSLTCFNRGGYLHFDRHIPYVQRNDAWSPIGAPAIFTTVTLNFIILWNEFLFAVVLLTDDNKRTLPLGIMHFTGSHQLDVGMVATGVMIAIVPIIIIYAFTSETIIKGMTAGAVR